MPTIKPVRDVGASAVTPTGSELILIDNGITMQRAVLNDAVTPKATALIDAAIDDLDLGTASQSDTGDFATAAQGATADTAVQPGDLATVATSGDYDDLTNLPDLGTAAAENTTAFAAAAQAVPVGGTTGQVLAKTSDTDNDVQWSDAGAGDMIASTYDPNNVGADAFSQDSMNDGDVNKNYTATEQTKLAGIEAAADVTDAANVDAAGAVMNTDTTTAAMGFVIDEDDMSSDSATKVPTQQSVKAYVDGKAPPSPTGAAYNRLYVNGDGDGYALSPDAVSPEMFGAVSDDSPSSGRIDSNTAAFQAMLDEGLPVRVGKGTFVLSHIDLPADVHMQGAGPLSIIRKAGSDLHLFEREDDADASTLFLRDLSFDGDITDFTSAGRNNADALVYFGPVSGLIDVRGCFFKDPRGRALYARSNGTSPFCRALVIGNTFTGGYECYLSATSGLTKSSVYVNIVDMSEAVVSFNFLDLGYDPVEYTGLSGITVTTFDTDNSLEPIKATIIGNLLRRLGKGGNGAGSGSTGALEVYKGGGQLIIAENRVTLSTARAINIKADSGDSIIANNIVHSSFDVESLASPPSGTSLSNGPGIVVNGSVEQSGSVENGFRVIGNRVRNVKAEGIFVEGEGQSTTIGDLVIVADNIVEATVGAAIRVNVWHRAMIHNNQVKNSGQHGISWSGIVDHLSVQGNLVDGCTNNCLNSFGAGNGTFSLAVKNNVLRNALTALNIDTVGRASVTGNLIETMSTSGIKVASAGGFHDISNNTLGSDVTQNFDIGTASQSKVWLEANKCELLEAANTSLNTIVPASGVGTAYRDWMYTNAGDSTAMSTINGGRDGAELTLIYNGGQIATGGNIKLSASPTTLNSNDTITLIKRNSNWLEKSRSANA